jgi:eukaryotic-like serine/threonine-protein kinase
MPGPIRDSSPSRSSPSTLRGGAIDRPLVPEPREPAPMNFDFLAAPREPDEVGRLAHYRVLEMLGLGGMGLVFRAEDIHLRRPVAIKVLRPDLLHDLDVRARFLREARAAAAVKSDHVVTIYQVGLANDVSFLAMELLQGETLDERLRSGDRPELPEVLRIGREIALGLAAAHEMGLIHRDVKPSNVWLEAPAGRVKLLDFGLVRSDRDNGELTGHGTVLGTPAYMAPEQARGEAVDARCDLFSLGVVLYRLCTGVKPFTGETTTAVLTALAVDQARPVQELNPDIPTPLVELVHRLLAKAPEGRPASARAVAETLQAIAPPRLPEGAGHGKMEACATPTARRPSPARPGTRFRWAALAAAALLTVGATVTGITLLGARGSRGPETNNVPAPPAPAKLRSDDEVWRERVAALRTPQQQVKAVAQKLQQLNPGFDGRVTPGVERGVVTGLVFCTDDVTDLSPVRAFASLRVLNCSGSAPGKGQLADLSPLRGMALEELTCDRNDVSDLAPLEGMKLTALSLQSCERAWDLTPLRGMPLTVLRLYVCPQVTDLAPLRGMKLTLLDAGSTGVSDLAPLAGMPLTYLNLFGCKKVKELTPLEGMPLVDLNITGCAEVSDLSPLRRLPLKQLSLEDCQKVRDVTPLENLGLEYLVFDHWRVTKGLSVLRAMKSLKTIDNASPPRLTATEFWARFDAGELRK